MEDDYYYLVGGNAYTCHSQNNYYNNDLDDDLIDDLPLTEELELIEEEEDD